ncbi:MAG TPA: alpha/beta fold hydrolase [Gammaproteobacteria bacterium]|nr:alpha/beta fold hydrolase [Gammaproteobacteria bacterium]
MHTNVDRTALIDDPPPTTPFEVVDECGLLRLRHYGPPRAASAAPVLFVYSLFKRPYVLDLLPERSLVQTFLREGFAVYVTDWLPPLSQDGVRGLHDYVNCDLAHAVECVRKREGAERISLVGCCLGGVLAVIYAALHPHTVERLVPFALPFDSRPPFPPGAAAQLVSLYGNVPSWWIRMALNSRVSNPFRLPSFLAEELGEPELEECDGGQRTDVQVRLEQWFGSDVPLAGRLFCEVMQGAFGDSQFAADRLQVGDRCVQLADIECPVLNISAERDLLVPPQDSAAFVERVGSREASNLVFPNGHLGLMVSRAAHETLWPYVASWLRGGVAERQPGIPAPFGSAELLGSTKSARSRAERGASARRGQS